MSCKEDARICQQLGECVCPMCVVAVRQVFILTAPLHVESVS